MQLAKAAIRAGLDLLLAEVGMAEDQLDRIIVAGAFGKYLDIDEAVAIGLLPQIPRDRIVQVGNAAGAGVRRILACGAARTPGQRIGAPGTVLGTGLTTRFPEDIHQQNPSLKVRDVGMATWTIIGERINPGFKSTKALFETEDIAGIQELALRQAKAGAAYLNVNTGSIGEHKPEFAAEVVRAIQAVVDVPLSFDSASPPLQEVYLKTFDASRAQGRKPMINSIAETRLHMMELLKIRPCKVILMASERLENGAGRRNLKSADVVSVAQRLLQHTDALGVPHDDVLVDVSISAMAADSEGAIRMALEAIRQIGTLPDLKGVHITGGLSNIGQQLPPKAVDGSDLKMKLECAFLTVATPLGFDTLLATPWKEYRLLPDEDFVLREFKEFIALDGVAALRRVRKLYRA